MTKEIEISINKTCQENWNSFDKNELGGFCNRCQKNVIDFTGKSEKEIFDFFSKKSSGVCGRFKPEQLKTYTYEKENIRLNKAAIITASILTLTQVDKSLAQEIKTEPTIERTLSKGDFNEKKKIKEKVDTVTRVITGHLFSPESNYNIVGV